jgi:hypothetical protein
MFGEWVEKMMFAMSMNSVCQGYTAWQTTLMHAVGPPVAVASECHDPTARILKTLKGKSERDQQDTQSLLQTTTTSTAI